MNIQVLQDAQYPIELLKEKREQLHEGKWFIFLESLYQL